MQNVPCLDLTSKHLSSIPQYLHNNSEAAINMALIQVHYCIVGGKLSLDT